jgi:hypothetical protein
MPLVRDRMKAAFRARVRHVYTRRHLPSEVVLVELVEPLIRGRDVRRPHGEGLLDKCGVGHRTLKSASLSGGRTGDRHESAQLS